jgi:adenosylcobinamide amidohydrolase
LNGITTEVVSYDVWGFPANSLVLLFGQGVKTLSGQAGYRLAKVVINCYMPKALWDCIHFEKRNWRTYFKEVKAEIASLYDIPIREITGLSTGVDMQDFTIASEQYRDLWVQTWVTAGFKHNAMRIGVDSASGFEKNDAYYPDGTINIIVATNAQLNLATMASSFISITEAKTIALEELDIRSSFNPDLMATGTGTDQIIIASGTDFRCRYAGGHTKLGELIARSVTAACKEALRKQLAKKCPTEDGGPGDEG